MYAFKTEGSVLLTGVSIGCSVSHSGSLSDIDMFRQNTSWHRLVCRKTEVELDSIDEEGKNVEQYSNKCAILADKGYTGVQSTMRAIIPCKKPAIA